jgi:NAD(P)-dependent dehydrogenase (short-subunit alcohol dehydrogenase family)
MMQAFAKELAPHNINVNAIVPGIIWTDMWAEGDEKLSQIFDVKKGEAFDKFTRELVLLPRAGKPEYIAPVTSFLASEDADYVTAATIPVGGGSMIY